MVDICRSMSLPVLRNRFQCIGKNTEDTDNVRRCALAACSGHIFQIYQRWKLAFSNWICLMAGGQKPVSPCTICCPDTEEWT